MLSKYANIIAALLLAAFSSYITYSINQYGWEKKWAQAERDSATATANAVRIAREQEQAKIKEQVKINEQYKKERDQAIASANNADAVSERLRKQIADLLSGSGRSTGQTSIVAERAAAATNALVLAELLRRADKRAGELARSADEYRLAGLQCQAEYNAL